MNVTAESYGSAVILNLKGELTEDVLNALRQAVNHQLEDREVIDIVLNLSAVPFMDSAGLEYLLDLQDSLAERLGQVKLLGIDENVRTILEMTRLRSGFEVYSDASDAVKTIQA